MKRVIYLLFIIFFIIILYLAYCISKEMFSNKDTESFLLGTTGISEICTPSMPEYANSRICYDISYIDPTTSETKQTKAKIEDGYYINASGLLEIVPYGYDPSVDKKSYFPKSNKDIYKQAYNQNITSIIDASLNAIQKFIKETDPTDKVTIQGYQLEIAKLQQEKTAIINSNKTSNNDYNPDNLYITYHADPLKETPADANNLSVGRMWINDASGNLKSVPYDEVKNTTLYYPSGSYVFNPPAYVPNYEDSVFLSKMTNLPTIVNTEEQPQDFCEETKKSMIERETKCNSLNKKQCKRSKCCVLFGGEKCVAGDVLGPAMKSNYSDITIINRDYYYYKGTCYGNCR